MRTHASITRDSHSRSVANAVAQRQRDSKADARFADHRPRAAAQQKPLQKKENKTGLPDHLKSGIEQLSGHPMDDVKVHFNSGKPAQMQAHAYAQGTDIHIASGQEKHLAHEAWHVVQQKQGRVKPTKQLRSDVAVNDDAGLEREADVMGARALQMKEATVQRSKKGNGAAVNVVQRLINVNNVDTSDYDVLEAIDMQNPPWMSDHRRTFVYDVLVPAYSAIGKRVGSIGQLVGEIDSIVDHYACMYDPGRFTGLVPYLNNQREVQAHARDHKALYKGLITTAGFEHEFADMENSPIAGVSHLLLAKSTEGLPFTGIKFKVETDASNALELVSPPFLLATTPGSTVPKSGNVDIVDNLMKWALYSILTERISDWVKDGYYNRTYITQTFQQLMGKLSGVTGFDFQLKNDIKIKPGNLSHNTDPDILKDHVTWGSSGFTLNPGSLENISVGKSEKSKNDTYRINSQVNFATDMDIAGPLYEQVGIDGPMDWKARDFRDIESALRDHIQKPVGGSEGLQSFYAVLLRKLTSLFAVYSQNYVREVQNQMHLELLMKNAGLQHEGTFSKEGSKEKFMLHGDYMTYVKDVAPIWIKDHALSIAKGMLTREDYPILLHWLQGVNLDGFDRPVELYSSGGQDEHWDAFKNEIMEAIGFLIREISLETLVPGLSFDMDDKPIVGLYEHDKSYTGARQDTYLDPKHVQMPEIHEKRLHVVEIRRGVPSKKLREIENKL